MGMEKRRYTRVVLKKEVLINGSIKAQGLDLSLGGLYIHTGRNFPVGTAMSVTLPLNSQIINVRAIVRNAQESLEPMGPGLEISVFNSTATGYIMSDFWNISRSK
jgi:hypothetical protein